MEYSAVSSGAYTDQVFKQKKAKEETITVVNFLDFLFYLTHVVLYRKYRNCKNIGT